MKYMRKTEAYNRTDYKTNAEIAKDLNITPVFDKTQAYRRQRLQRINRYSQSRLKNHRPAGRRN
jgi:phage anti-repressor protein